MFGKWYYEKENPDVYDEDELYELARESALYVEPPPLDDITVTFYPRDIYRLDTNALLESIEQLPYEFRCYYDARKAFRRAFELCREELSGFISYEGGRSASENASFGYDDHKVTIDFTLSRENDKAPYAFTANIHFC